MSDAIIVNSETALAEAKRQLEKTWRENKYLEIEVRRVAKQRSLTQNAAMHLWFGWMAETLNDAGYDMRRTLKHDADMPWSPATVKEFLWRPIQQALTQKRSTTEITTVEPTEIYDVLCRHLGEKLGVQCPEWPKKRDNAA
tara:strand:+ start:2463 stop:2885 length:423 start_codon:yes stop_codon:yes gene_type:complete